MGSVWRAFDGQLRREVAIKFMHQPRGGGKRWHDWFEREALAIARLQHPNVVQVYDYGVDDQDRPFIVMELLQGEDLAKRLRRVKQLALSAAVPIVTQVAKALDAAHVRGVVHRDLKPANIFLARQGADEVTKILDFGVAALLSSMSAPEGESVGESDDERVGERIVEHNLVGTPQYMSPEQASSGGIDHRTDLWSLAVVAYETLTGRHPFRGSTMLDILHRVCNEPPVPPAQLMRNAPPGINEFFAQALAKEQCDRYQSAHEMAAAFARLLHDARAQPTVKVLVVDDEPDMELLVTQRFRRDIRRKKYQFMFAQNGAEALQKLEEHGDIDLAVTDLNMPVMDGFGFLSRVESIAPTVCTIVLTAYGDMDNIRHAMNLGAFDFLNKPIDFGDFETTVKKAAQHVRELRSAVQTMAENNALRMLVAPGAVKRLVPALGVSRRQDDASERLLMAVRVSAPTEAQADTQSTPAILAALNEQFDTIASTVTVYGGRVLHFLSTVTVAEFDSRNSLEDALQACLRVRSLLDSERTRPTVAIALAAGPVISGNIGSRSLHHFQPGCVGAPIDLALRGVLHTPPGLVAVAAGLVARLPDWCTAEPADADDGLTPEFARISDLAMASELDEFMNGPTQDGMLTLPTTTARPIPHPEERSKDSPPETSKGE